MKKTVTTFLLALLGSFTFAQEIKKIKITDLETIIQESTTPLIVNFWATWCKPCIEEIPHFEQAAQKHVKDSLSLLLISLDMEEDYPEQIVHFANRLTITSPILWLDETDADYFCPKVDEKWSGALPATLFINNKTGYRKFLEQPLSEDELENEIAAMLKRK